MNTETSPSLSYCKSEDMIKSSDIRFALQAEYDMLINQHLRADSTAIYKAEAIFEFCEKFNIKIQRRNI